jgi:hypothetical protein
MRCPTCGSETIQRSRARLLVVALLMIGATGLVFVIPYFWIPAVVLLLASGYLIAWATLGQGRWCRQCKKFSVQI